jgi:hypothetical protein
LLLGPDEDDETRPSDDEAALEELELSACAAKATTLDTAMAQKIMDFIMPSTLV